MSDAAPLPDWRCNLSRRQVEVCELVAQGLMNKEIARIMHIGFRTIEDHRLSAMKKLGVTNRVKLVRIVLGHDAALPLNPKARRRCTSRPLP